MAEPQDNWKPPSAQEVWLPPSAKPIDTTPQQDEPGFVSRAEEFGQGLLNLAGNITKSGILPQLIPGYQNQQANQAMNQMVTGPAQTAISGHPLKAVAQIAGFNPDEIYNDVQAGRYGAAAGGVIPQVAMLGLGGLLHSFLGAPEAAGIESTARAPMLDIAP